MTAEIKYVWKYDPEDFEPPPRQWLDDRFDYELTARTVKCPTCGASWGEQCRSVLSGPVLHGELLKACHEKREAAAYVQLEAAHEENCRAVAVSASTKPSDRVVGSASEGAPTVGVDTGPAVAAPTLTAPFADAGDVELRLGETTDGGHGRPYFDIPVRGALLDCGHESMLPAELLQGESAWCPTCFAWRGFGVSL